MARLPRAENRIRRALAANLLRIRKERDLSAIRLGDAACVHWRHIQKIEAGEANVTLKTLSRLAQALGVEPHELLMPRPPAT